MKDTRDAAWLIVCHSNLSDLLIMQTLFAYIVDIKFCIVSMPMCADACVCNVCVRACMRLE